MTGFGSRECRLPGLGRVSVELRSTNCKFLDIILHLSEGYFYLEEKIKQMIAKKIKRGRITVGITINNEETNQVFMNKRLLKKYIMQIQEIKKEFKIQESMSLEGLINLPGVLALTKVYPSKKKVWLGLKGVLRQALEDLLRMRQKEGQALKRYLNVRLELMRGLLGEIKRGFKSAMQQRLRQIKTDEERNSFIKDVDISEEIARLNFHLNNFAHKLSGRRTAGKELDFLAQEMQREAATMAAKSFDTFVSANIVRIRTQVEQLREQLQNIE
ncbi:MAG: YicC family protein [Candidatus Omnitrophica bacterium]|nr:YicC family protein [Candidatus Omnitrophota bacterium]